MLYENVDFRDTPVLSACVFCGSLIKILFTRQNILFVKKSLFAMSNIYIFIFHERWICLLWEKYTYSFSEIINIFLILSNSLNLKTNIFSEVMIYSLHVRALYVCRHRTYSSSFQSLKIIETPIIFQIRKL